MKSNKIQNINNDSTNGVSPSSSLKNQKSSNESSVSSNCDSIFKYSKNDSSHRPKSPFTNLGK